MNIEAKDREGLSQEELADLVIESESGARNPSNKNVARLMFWTSLFWAVFQLWVASPLQYTAAEYLKFPVFNDNQVRSIHLTFALFLTYLAYPAFKRSPRRRIPLLDWGFALVGAYTSFYLYINYLELAERPGDPIPMDIYVGCAGIVLLLEAARRSLGMPLVIIATIFLIYTLAGASDFIPEVISHKGQSLNKTISHQWLTTEGVFGIAIGVSSGFVFMFVLFGALLDRAGAGNYFIKLAFSLLGHMKGGPAKAAVASSAMMGMVSGSSIASTVTIGTFTIPLMKRVGFTGVKAGAIEVASAVNAQIMPPVMGAAAFLIAEYVNIPYDEVVIAAFVPAAISYIALFYIVHLEAVKADMKSFEKTTTHSLQYNILMWLSIFLIVGGLSFGIYHFISFIKDMAGANASYLIGFVLLAAYIGLVWYVTKFPEIEADDPNSPDIKLAETAPTFFAGLHYLLPIVILIWCLMVERLSPGLSAFWASAILIFILPTQHALKAYFRKTGNYKREFKSGFEDLIDGMIMGSRNMVGVAIATAAAGLIVGTVSLTGVGQVLTEVVEIVAGDSIFLILFMTAVISLILGMGLPTTANYIVVASLMTHVVVQLGQQNGLVVPLIAVHLFVFYFGIMADITPPVGLASFAASAISGADPIRTGLQGFTYALRTAILPFFFIFDNEILLLGVDSFIYGLWVFVKSTIGLMLFAAASQGYFIVKCKAWETICLILIAFTLFAPQFWIDQIFPDYIDGDITKIDDEIKKVSVGQQFKIRVKGLDFNTDEIKEKNVYISVANEDKTKVIEEYGLVLRKDGDKLIVDDLKFNSGAEKAGIDFDYEILSISLPQEQPSKNYSYIPAFLLLIFIFMSQSFRRKQEIALKKNKFATV